MKKNFVLLCSLALLLVFTFYFQEKKEIFQSSKVSLISDSLPESLVIGDSIFQKKSNQYFYRKYPIKVENIKKWKDYFNDLEVLGEVDKPFGEVVTRIKFDDKSLRFYQVNQMTGNFCVHLKGKYHLVQANHEFRGFYKDEIERKVRSYEYFIHQLTSFKKNLIPPLFSDVKTFKRIVGEVQKVVSFIDLSTIPAPIKPLGIDKFAFEKFKKKLESLTPSDIQDLSTEELEEMASFEVEDAMGKRAFKFYQFGIDIFLKDLQTEAYLEFKQNDLDFMFSPMKDFWNKKIIDLSVVDKLDISIQGLTQHKFQVDRQLNFFSDKGKRDKLLEQSLKEVLCYMSHCRENYSYLDVAPLDEGLAEGKKMSILGQSYTLKLKDNLLHISDDKNKLQYKYLWPLSNKENPFLRL